MPPFDSFGIKDAVNGLLPYTKMLGDSNDRDFLIYIHLLDLCRIQRRTTAASAPTRVVDLMKDRPRCESQVLGYPLGGPAKVVVKMKYFRHIVPPQPAREYNSLAL